MPYDALRNQLQGELLEPGSQAYDIAQIVWNGMIDRGRPLHALHAEHRRGLVASRRRCREYRVGAQLLARHAAPLNRPTYLNFPGHGEDDDLVRNAFGAQAYTRLQEIKRKYDPANLFRMNQNIQPA